MVAILALGISGSVQALLPLDSVPSGGSKFILGPRLDGWTVAACNGVSPVSNACATSFAGEDCAVGCFPQIGGTLGYTGTVRAMIQGIDVFGMPASVWKECSYIAGQAGSAGAVRLGGCAYGSNAPRTCGVNCVELRPPFTLTGVASAPPLAVKSLGPWTVSVVR